MTAHIQQPWAPDHHLYLLARTESRPAPTGTNGEQWMEYRHTGKVTIVCACGYNTGLVDAPTGLDYEALAAEHASTMGPFTRLGRTG
ncbi:hypothetical protein OIE75_20310 [Streptomyces sp. NBC_01723]|uniref:hypothetical protein n=1 Tax=Streptomyces sp. NBC_01723 TaxID=2975921 RepID=UPI002E37ED7E|nr:hypothetical protein [Streptomyces sp. NBC_01723]